MKKRILASKSLSLGFLIGAMIGTSLLLTSCKGEKVKKEDDGGRIVEHLDENGAVVQEVEKETEEIEAEKPAETTEAIEKDKITNVENTKDYLEYVSEDEKRQLAIEALQAQGMDTSLAEGRLKTRGIEVEFPEDFYESEEVPGLYITDRYPIDAANIVYGELDVDYTLQLMDEEYFAELISDMFFANYGEDVDITITEFTRYKQNGVPAFRVVAEYDLEDNHFKHMMYVFNGSKTYTLIYTQTSDYDRTEIFEASAETITIKK